MLPTEWPSDFIMSGIFFPLLIPRVYIANNTESSIATIGFPIPERNLRRIFPSGSVRPATVARDISITGMRAVKKLFQNPGISFSAITFWLTNSAIGFASTLLKNLARNGPETSIVGTAIARPYRSVIPRSA